MSSFSQIENSSLLVSYRLSLPKKNYLLCAVKLFNSIIGTWRELNSSWVSFHLKKKQLFSSQAGMARVCEIVFFVLFDANSNPSDIMFGSLWSNNYANTIYM